jgi:ferredoxin
VAEDVSNIIERTIGDLTVRIDHSLCVGFAQCIDEAEEAFTIDDDDHAVFDEPERVPREKLLRACRVCPVEALIVVDGGGNQVVP